MQERNALFRELSGLGLYARRESEVASPLPCLDPPDLRARPRLRLGNSGEHVKYLQRRLNCHKAGYRHPMLTAEAESVSSFDAIDPLKADGIFGPKTRRAVLLFQFHRALEQDGVVGPDTWAKLNTGSGYILTGGPLDEMNLLDMATVIKSEAGAQTNTELERTCVGWVYRNRFETDRRLLATGQFSRLKKAQKDDRFYKIAEAVKASNSDPTSGAIFFFSPKSMPAGNVKCPEKVDCGGGPHIVMQEMCVNFPGFATTNEPVEIKGIKEWNFKFYKALPVTDKARADLAAKTC